ncbi:hypothetical protein NLJ89_g1204 [Agrocybe chaxingu]|uniref:Uncharacterized protein n=1 Tax=Agrocybe chaxingu TaxID=84603 RepID=A0A9W8N0J7_9AGAR|nr:hypothetical protein NLJ89_g1204 [Agrocybe chaxingu]
MLPPRAYTFIGLNIIRVLSIIALLLVFASNVVTQLDDFELTPADYAPRSPGIRGSKNFWYIYPDDSKIIRFVDMAIGNAVLVTPLAVP